MSDRSWVSITVYRATLPEWERLLRLCEDHGISADFDPGLPDFPAEIIDEEVRIGSLATLGKVVANELPGVVLWGSQDSYYQDYGDIFIQTDLGPFAAEADNQGNLPGYIYRDALAKAKDLDHFRQLIHEYDKHLEEGARWARGDLPTYAIEEVPV